MIPGFSYENPCQEEEEEEKKSANKKEVTFVMEFMVRMKSADMENTCYITRDYIDYPFFLNLDLYLKNRRRSAQLTLIDASSSRYEIVYTANLYKRVIGNWQSAASSVRAFDIYFSSLFTLSLSRRANFRRRREEY